MEERFHLKVPNRALATLRRRVSLARPLGDAHKGLDYRLATLRRSVSLTRRR